MKKCAECVNFHACELWNMGDMENTNADHCTLYETVKDTAAYYLGLCDGAGIKWTPITERLPEVDKPILATGIRKTDGKTYLGWVRRTKSGEIRGAVLEDEDIDDGEITIIAWMPLPEPYREVEK